jgi:hypothetical protein
MLPLDLRPCKQRLLDAHLAVPGIAQVDAAISHFVAGKHDGARPLRTIAP